MEKYSHRFMKANSSQENNDINPKRANTLHEEFILELMNGESMNDYPKNRSSEIQKKQEQLKQLIEWVCSRHEKKPGSASKSGIRGHTRHSSRAAKNELNDLKSRSKIFARILREIGCEEGATVCCIMSNSKDFLTALLGIKYAGCKALPMALDQPLNHIQSLIFDSSTEWLVVDRSARFLLETENLGQNSLNIAWMDSPESIPENCYPEFTRDNIDHISMYPVYSEPDKTEPVITFQTFDEKQGRLKKNTFTQKDIDKVVSPILEILNICSESKIAGWMSCHSPSVLLEAGSLSRCDASFFLFDPSQEKFGNDFIRKINDLEITHLFMQSEILKESLPQVLAANTVNSNVNEVVLWGRPSGEILNRLNTVFPGATFYTVSMDRDKNISIRIASKSAFQFIRGNTAIFTK